MSWTSGCKALARVFLPVQEYSSITRLPQGAECLVIKRPGMLMRTDALVVSTNADVGQYIPDHDGACTSRRLP